MIKQMNVVKVRETNSREFGCDGERETPVTPALTS